MHQAAVTLFSRICDLENFSTLLDALGTEEETELAHRLGILNMINPMTPDRFFSLDLRIWEHRELCKASSQQKGAYGWIISSEQCFCCP